ncbi:sortilin-related receptor-like [Ornithodoros turicata]|uniref:sortilin-related receptor-like n=1 Tax=Ornithodoros turicata TaxID=34597 RepID=UPI00313889C1
MEITGGIGMILRILVVHLLVKGSQSYGQSSSTLHIAADVSSLTHTFYADSNNAKAQLNSPSHVVSRTRRSAMTAPTLNTTGMLSTFALNSSAQQLKVHWVGAGSPVVVCLAKDVVQIKNGTTMVYVSNDYGTTFKEIQAKHMRLKDGSPSEISTFYISSVLNSHWVFADVAHKYIFTSRDMGRTFDVYSMEFSPTLIVMHPTNVELMLAMDKNDRLNRLWLSEDFGVSWVEIQREVKSFFWGEPEIDPESKLYVGRSWIGGTMTVFSSSNLFKSGYPEVLISGVEDFEVKEKYIFASKRQHLLGSKEKNGTLMLWVSYDRGEFRRALFPNHLEHNDYFIAEASEDQLFACVKHGNYSNLYISDYKGHRFSLSLERILYFKSPRKDAELDLHRVKGVRGVYIATQVRPASGADEHPFGMHDDLVSLITFDKGGSWQPIKPPPYHHDGSPVKCELNAGCSLHLTQKFSIMYSGSRSMPILSEESGAGLVLAMGVIGTSLKGRPSLYVSHDAGVTWREALYGNYLYSFADFGGVIVATEFYAAGGETATIKYSLDMGEQWSEISMPNNQPIRVYGLLTEPGEKTAVFTLFGSKPNVHEWLLIKVDMRNAFQYECTADDYKPWSPKGNNGACLLGRREEFEVRIPHSRCYNGRDYKRPKTVHNCPCTRADYECDFGFMEDLQEQHCIRDPDSDIDPHKVPSDCSEGKFYNHSKGYRKVSGNTCEGGDHLKYDVEVISCPRKTDTEFLILGNHSLLNRVLLSKPAQKDWEPLLNADVACDSGAKNIITFDYDYHKDCIYWVCGDDVAKINKRCLSSEGETETTDLTDHGAVKYLAVDWISGYVYVLHENSSRVGVVMQSSKSRWYYRTIFSHEQGVVPLSIALHPGRGYIFQTSRTGISRSHLDGSEFKVLMETLGLTISITVDFHGDRIFWASPFEHSIMSADFDGKNVKTVIDGAAVLPFPYTVAVYKEWIYIVDAIRHELLSASKHDGSGLHVLARPLYSRTGAKVYSSSLQQGWNACSRDGNNNCSHFCFARGSDEYRCLCPSGESTKLVPGYGEKCLCENGEEMHKDEDCRGATAAPAPTCLPDQFKCDDNSCIFLHWKCDRDTDCDDGSDEVGCVNVTCPPNQFLCGNDRCIPDHWRCDSEDDCGDNSDEENCGQPSIRCGASRFQCKSIDHRCVPMTWVCDGEVDCLDGSDEAECSATNVTCPSWKFRCKNGRACIFRMFLCDGSPDCGDSSDEANCTTVTPPTTSTTTTTTPKPTSCASWMFHCPNGRCIPFWWRCDGAEDCSDGSDEQGCFHTVNTTTPAVQNSSTLPSTCSEEQFMCNTGKCIWNAWLCDGEPDCKDGEDEKYCPGSSACTPDQFHCFRTLGCIPKDQVCNGKADCVDGSDEWGCTTPSSRLTPCPANELPCYQGNECFSLHQKCDGTPDCADASDEMDCRTEHHIVRGLQLDNKHVTQTTIRLTWQPPGGNTSFEYLPTIQTMSTGMWHNETWTPKLSYTFGNMTPGVHYRMGVYVRIHGNATLVFRPEKYIVASTLSAAPSPPHDVQVKQVLNKKVEVTWMAPKSPNGAIRSYRVYFRPPEPEPFMWSTDGNSTSAVIDFSFEPGVNYTFWVTAIAQDQLESLRSETTSLVFAKNDVLPVVDHLRVTGVGNTTANVTWDRVTSPVVDGYRVMWSTNVGDLHPLPWDSVNTNMNYINLTSLSPGTKCSVKVFAFKDNFHGPEEKVDFVTKGQPLPAPEGVIFSVNGSRVSLHWRPVSTHQSGTAWVYGVYKVDSHSPPVSVGNTTASVYTVENGLEACEVYVFQVRVVAPLGVGPASVPQSVMTEYSAQAPPRDVQVKTARYRDDGHVIVTWKASCFVIDRAVGYMVYIRDNRTGVEDLHSLPTTNNTLLSMSLAELHPGATYVLQICTSVPNARLSAPTLFVVPALAAPRQLAVVPERNGSLYIHWKAPQLPPSMKDDKIVHVVYISNYKDLKDAKQYNVSQPPLIISSLPSGKVYHIAVSMIDEHGFESLRSDTVEVGILAERLSVSTGSMAGVVAGAVFIIITLAAVVAFLVVRHRRLQRSFVSFANTHYDTRSGATTFTTASEVHEMDEEEEDEPVIRGFSDDEPLVIA